MLCVISLSLAILTKIAALIIYRFIIVAFLLFPLTSFADNFYIGVGASFPIDDKDFSIIPLNSSSDNYIYLQNDPVTIRKDNFCCKSGSHIILGIENIFLENFALEIRQASYTLKSKTAEKIEFSENMLFAMMKTNDFKINSKLKTNYYLGLGIGTSQKENADYDNLTTLAGIGFRRSRRRLLTLEYNVTNAVSEKSYPADSFPTGEKFIIRGLSLNYHFYFNS